MDFWDELQSLAFTNEASVETNLVLPLLAALGYKQHEISPKHPVVFQQGRSGRKPEADFVVFDGDVWDQKTSLMVIEAKRPSEQLSTSITQAESYAFNVRAPVLLVTNGVDFEIWQLQPTMDSQCVLASSVRHLAAKRGDVERLISKSALVTYSESLRHKALTANSNDYEDYEIAEIARTLEFRHTTERTLISSDGRDQVPSSLIFEQFPAGAVILAPSGYGKTTLARTMLRQSLLARRKERAAPLAFDVPLTDLAVSRRSIVEFMVDRVFSHCPGTTEAILRKLLREEGAYVFCDAFDRLSSDHQREIVTDLKILSRDYPKIRLFIFSRGSTKPNLPLSTLKLAQLTDQQQHSLASALEIDAFVLHCMPPLLRTLCHHPLLMFRTLRYWQQHNSYPVALSVLFEDWLSVVVRHDDADFGKAIERERALSILAEATIQSTIDRVEAIERLSEKRVRETTFTELISCDALQIDGPSIELVHESLADYLRAKTLTKGSEAEVIERLTEARLEPDALLPILLMALLPSRKLQRILWRRLANVAWDTYADSLRFRGDISSTFGSLDNEAFAIGYLEDLLEGFELPLNGFFPSLRAIVIRNLTHGQSTNFGVAGEWGPTKDHLRFGLATIDEEAPRVSIGTPSFCYPIYILELGKTGRRPDDARTLGIRELQQRLHAAFSRRSLLGGCTWQHERLIGRIRYLERHHGFPLDGRKTLIEIREAIALFVEQLRRKALPFPTTNFDEQSLVGDLVALQNSGILELDFWWSRLGWTDIGRASNQIVIAVVKEHFERAQTVYYEVVQNSFKEVSSNLGFFSSLPVRWTVELLRHHDGIAMFYHWLPVSQWDEAVADVSFVQKPSLGQNFRIHHRNVEEARARLGRGGRHPRIFGASTGLPDFLGRNHISFRFTGETSAFIFACELIQEDLVQLFGDLAHWSRV